MTLLMQISDTHFGTEQPAVVEALVRLVHRQAPEVIVVSGDITQRATRKQFDAASAFFKRLGNIPILTIPGNHDIPLFNLAARLLAPFGNYSRAFGDDLEPVFRSPRWLIVCVNTTRAYRHKDGEVSSAQVQRVADLLQTAALEQLRIVVVHQPVAVITEVDRTNLLHGRHAAMRGWATAGADIVMGGHIHVPYALPLHECYEHLPGRLWTVQAGTAVSRRVRRESPNSVNLIRYSGPRQCILERWDCKEPELGFQCYSALTLA
ncbi:metallophosphoesterase family protein [Candidatus Methylobacter oryzae]|uniref:Metallophosphoesterase n=1 Tax=Candidatus Methylobacter oryzae TaxID=2497749 RepID=A0ABY3CB37_9GAMM|nr:metallophosphoesterase [Candidatus Methylobacter oryzae]TRW95250.1 metallophosphoesterase [Candidatus Methylobacter oryzae]